MRHELDQASCAQAPQIIARAEPSVHVREHLLMPAAGRQYAAVGLAATGVKALSAQHPWARIGATRSTDFTLRID